MFPPLWKCGSIPWWLPANFTDQLSPPLPVNSCYFLLTVMLSVVVFTLRCIHNFEIMWSELCLPARFPLPLYLSLAQNSPSMSAGQQGMGVPKVRILHRFQDEKSNCPVNINYQCQIGVSEGIIAVQRGFFFYLAVYGLFLSHLVLSELWRKSKQLWELLKSSDFYWHSL